LQEEQIKNEVIANNIKALFDGVLYHLATGKLLFKTDCSRVTLYIHDKVDKFISFGRYSTNPKFRNPGRSEYPDDKGAISHAWNDGWHFINNTEGGFDFVNFNKNTYGLTADVLKKIKMKSRMYGAMRIDNQRGEQIAIILVESTDGSRFLEDELKSILKHEITFISELIMQLKEYIPMSISAKEKGL